MSKLKNIYPGEVLLEEFLIPMNISQDKLARDIDIPKKQINEIIQGMRFITSDIDFKLAHFLGTSEGFWLNLQADYDLEEKLKKSS